MRANHEEQRRLVLDERYDRIYGRMRDYSVYDGEWWLWARSCFRHSNRDIAELYTPEHFAEREKTHALRAHRTKRYTPPPAFITVKL